MRYVPILMLSLVGCHALARTPDLDAGAISTVSPATAPIAPDDLPASRIVSRAAFDARNELAFCSDIDVATELDAQTWSVRQRREAVARLGTTDAGPAGFSLAVIDEACANAFSDRLVLATCRTTDGSFVYYSFDLLKNDLEMKDCLTVLHGDWSALPRTSREYVRAKARYDAERLLEQARGMQ